MFRTFILSVLLSISIFGQDTQAKEKAPPYCQYKEFYDSGVFETPNPNLVLTVSKFHWRDIFNPLDGCGLNGETIYELVRRYSLEGKSIIAFGPGQAREERFFFFNGMNPVVLVDFTSDYLEIDKIEEKNKWAENKEYNITPDLDHVYFIKTIQEHASVNPLLQNKFDVAFISGSTIQEFRGICLKQSNPNIEIEWPVDKKVFVKNVILPSTCLKNGGLLIIQNWASGNVPIHCKNYLTAAREELEKNGLQLIEVYARSKGGTAKDDATVDSVHLFIAYKGSKESALNYYDEIKKNEEIKSIFGSYLYLYPDYKSTKKVYSITR
ncbi:MAG: hypothetical protein Q8910_01240 [Bacteroidota bacterium]|nr:hypothetical protein [Bacteroidota bacterium]